MLKQQTISSKTDEEVEQLISTFKCREDIAYLLEPNGIGIELGVAEGMFSEKILKNSSLEHLYSVDLWGGDRAHDTVEYIKAIRRLMPYRRNNSILRLRFDEALDLFPDNYFDFIYIDGYAHTGEEHGQTFRDWYPKLKPGGLFAGDDYSSSWPLVIEEVDKFVSENNLKLFVINCEPGQDRFSLSPTWFVRNKQE